MVDCKSSNKTCNKVKSEFEKAGQEIAKTIKLNTPIYVNVSFYNFCEVAESEEDCENSIGMYNNKKKKSYK